MEMKAIDNMMLNQRGGQDSMLLGCKKNITLGRIKPLLFLLPALLIYGGFFLFPFIYSIYLSFMHWNLASSFKEFVAFQNYVHLFADRIFWRALFNTVVYTLATAVPLMVLGLLVAVLVEGSGRFKEVYRVLLFLPVVSSLAATALVWILMMSPTDGMINAILFKIGLAGPNWLNDPTWAMVSIIIVGIWKTLGYNMVLFITGMKSIDRQVYEAAELDGAGPIRQFFVITWPLISPVTLFVLVVNVIQSFQAFTAVYIMTRGGPNNATNILVYQVWQEAFQFFDIGKASALSIVLFLLVLAVSILQIRLMDKNIHYA